MVIVVYFWTQMNCSDIAFEHVIILLFDRKSVQTVSRYVRVSTTLQSIEPCLLEKVSNSASLVLLRPVFVIFRFPFWSFFTLFVKLLRLYPCLILYLQRVRSRMRTSSCTSDWSSLFSSSSPSSSSSSFYSDVKRSRMVCTITASHIRTQVSSTVHSATQWNKIT